MGVHTSKRARGLSPNARFWQYVNGTFVKLTLGAGESLQHHSYQRDEEGFTASLRTWTYEDNGLVSFHVWTKARDCDGRSEYSGTYMASFFELRAATPSEDFETEHPDVKHVPRWQQTDEWQRDYSAERAGY